MYVGANHPASINHLDYNPTTAYQDVNKAFRELGTKEEHFNKVFGEGNWNTGTPKARHIVINTLLERVHYKTAKSRAMEWKQKVQLESHDKLNKGWACVFGTLTANNYSIRKVFSKGTKEWRYYRLKCQHLAGMAAYGSKKKYKKHKPSEYFTCIAVTEYGEKSGRPHIHYLMYFKAISFSDPNLGRVKTNYGQINALKKLWTNGHSAPIAFRYGPGDAYGKKGWKNVNFKNDPNKLVAYVCKYIMKSYLNPNKHLPWRVRATQNFGCNYIITTLEKLTDETLYNLYHSKQTLGELVHGKPLIPTYEKHQFEYKTLSIRLKRKLILKESMKRLKERNIEPLKILKSVKNSQPRPSIVEILTKRHHNERELPNWQSIGYNPTPESMTKAIYKFYEQFQLEVYGENYEK